MISVKQIIVKYMTLPILLHCDVIKNIQHLPIRRSKRQSHLRSVYFLRYLRFCPEVCKVDPHDLVNEIDNEKKIFMYDDYFFNNFSLCYGEPNCTI